MTSLKLVSGLLVATIFLSACGSSDTAAEKLFSDAIEVMPKTLDVDISEDLSNVDITIDNTGAYDRDYIQEKTGELSKLRMKKLGDGTTQVMVRFNEGGNTYTCYGNAEGEVDRCEND
jgi:hypothetical protein